MKKICVKLEKNSYDIIVESGLLKNIANYINTEAKKVFVITDENVAKLYLERVKSSLLNANFAVDCIIFPAGEKTKKFENLPKIYDKMLQFGMTRKDLIITLGGGVVGDLGGFAAATYLRGIDYIQAPTTLLAQVDSSIGGKVAVDLPQGKNLVGNFWQPKCVLVDTSALESLSDKIFCDGMAEVIKYGCISDKGLFDMLVEDGGRKNVMKHIELVVEKCCKIKAELVEIDERDIGARMTLNFGHTYGHALEKYYNFEKLSHGEAIAVGMYFITCLNENACKDALKLSEKIKNILTMYNLPFEDCAKPCDVVDAIAMDKKNMGKTLNVILLKDIGDCYIYKTSLDYFLK